MRTRHAAALVGILASVLVACSSGAQPGGTFAPTPPPAQAPRGAGGAPPRGGARASAAPGGSPAASAAASGGGAATTVLALTASGIAFDKTDLTAPAGTAFQIAFTNNDAGIPHNVVIHKDSPTGQIVWQGAIITGPATQTYDVPALPAGTYGFSCIVHPNITGTLTVK